MARRSLFVILTGLMLVLSGCMYPSGERAGNEMAYEDQLASVQQAVDQYREASGGPLPIKTTEDTTPIFQKYLIDFSKLRPQFLSEVPGSAFEAGGVFQYTLINVEEEPTVKIFDLRHVEEIRSLQIRIQANRGIPFEGQLGDNVYSIDFAKLGYDEPPMVMSPYTGQELPLVANGDGTIFVDYRTDLYQLTQDMELTAEEGEDLRPILYEESMFVPAYSMPYVLGEDGEIEYGDSRDTT